MTSHQGGHPWHSRGPAFIPRTFCFQLSPDARKDCSKPQVGQGQKKQLRTSSKVMHFVAEKVALPVESTHGLSSLICAEESLPGRHQSSNVGLMSTLSAVLGE